MRPGERTVQIGCQQSSRSGRPTIGIISMPLAGNQGAKCGYQPAQEHQGGAVAAENQAAAAAAFLGAHTTMQRRGDSSQCFDALLIDQPAPMPYRGQGPRARCRSRPANTNPAPGPLALVPVEAPEGHDQVPREWRTRFSRNMARKSRHNPPNGLASTAAPISSGSSGPVQQGPSIPVVLGLVGPSTGTAM